MDRLRAPLAVLLIASLQAACGAAGPGRTTSTATQPSSTSGSGPAPLTILVDTDVAADDLVALAFLLSAPNVTVGAITVSGTGEATCAHGPTVVLRLLERLAAPDIPVACGRETPLQGSHQFPDPWRMGADAGSGLQLPTTTRTVAPKSAVDVIRATVAQHDQLTVLTLGPLTNLADTLLKEPSIAPQLDRVVVMGGAVHVPGNLLGPGAPQGNQAAEWNIYVDPHAAQVVLGAGVQPQLVSLDGTSQVPVTPAFVERVRASATGPGARVLVDLFTANPFMADGSYFLWDPLAAELAAGFPIGRFSPVAVTVTEADGAESGATRASAGSPNAAFLETVDAGAAEATLLDVLNRP
jgi:inosine-uridine nucleoside N-ribohydrolase